MSVLSVTRTVYPSPATGFTSGCMVESLLFIFLVICFVLFVFVLCLVPNVAYVSALSILDCLMSFPIRDRPFNLRGGGGGYGFLFRSEFIFRTTPELEYLFFLLHEVQFFFQNLTLDYMSKTLNQIIFFPSTKIRIFFSATLGIRIFFLEKNHNLPFKLNDRSLSLFSITKQ